LEQNKLQGFPLLDGVRVVRGDVRDFDFEGIPEGIDLVSGGPPCQPFSLGGRGRGFNDDRDMFNAFAEVVARLKPRSFIIENVKGLTRASFANYLQYIEHRMAMPEIAPRPGEAWPQHLRRLERELTSFGDHGVRYSVSRRLYNAADFGAPQKRERVFFVGFRTDQDVHWSFPEPTHSIDALLHDQWVTGEYWDRHKISKSARGDIPARMVSRVARLKGSNDVAEMAPWRTVRDGIKGLPAPRPDGRDARHFTNHRFQAGAKPYPGHTGSPIDMPSKALKAGDHGVPGGENMMVLPDGSCRYFTAREAARMQTFPDGYVFHGAWSEIMRQLGNAVPVVLAQAVASSVAQNLIQAKMESIAMRMRAN
jgi:DNA (cytosine-5)-methyltransferase 1